MPRFTSTIPVGTLYEWIEQPLRGPTQPTEARRFTGLSSPRWPEQVLGAIDRDLAAQGARLYADRCSGCHLPGTDTEAFWTGRHWLAANAAGERYLDLRQIPISAVGTDPAQAADMAARRVRVRPALGLGPAHRVGRDGAYLVYPFGNALGDVVERVVNRWYDDHQPPLSEADRVRMNGNRPNGIRADLGYKARPLNGIWATAPFLHNGSVRTLWELLSPLAERRAFSSGTREFDPVRVGYVDSGSFRLDTTRRGNLNTGHLFDVATAGNRGQGIIGPQFSPDQRRAIIEYLKTL
jgi:hypothetical protein